MPKEYQEVIDGLTRLIMHHLSRVEAESHNPTEQADASDHYIQTHRQAAARLRTLRSEVENLSARSPYLDPR